MKSNQQDGDIPNEIRLNHIHYNLLDPEVEIYYFEKLNLLIFQYDVEFAIECNLRKIMVHTLVRGIDN